MRSLAATLTKKVNKQPRATLTPPPVREMVGCASSMPSNEEIPSIADLTIDDEEVKTEADPPFQALVEDTLDVLGPPWVFVPMQELCIMGNKHSGCWLGEVYYGHKGYDMSSAVRIKDYVFVHEHVTPEFAIALASDIGLVDPSLLLQENAIVALHGTKYYKFANCPSKRDYVNTIFTTFIPLICEELFTEEILNALPPHRRGIGYANVSLEGGLRLQLAAVSDPVHPQLLFGGGGANGTHRIDIGALKRELTKNIDQLYARRHTSAPSD